MKAYAILLDYLNFVDDDIKLECTVFPVRQFVRLSSFEGTSCSTQRTRNKK